MYEYKGEATIIALNIVICSNNEGFNENNLKKQIVKNIARIEKDNEI